jgi:exodeoxyribonuclease VII large subunit
VRALTPSEAAERVVPASDDIAAALKSHQQRLLSALGRRATLIRTRLDWLAQRRALARPLQRIRDLERRLDELSSRSARAVRRRWQEARRRADAGAARLESLSPLAVLGRGYSLTHRLADGSLVRDASQLTAGERIVTRFDRGRAVSRVEQIEPGDSTS